MSETLDFKINDTPLGYFRSFFGIPINLRCPKPEDIDIRDIAAALSKICRFGGHCRTFYSVAQHSILVAHLTLESLAGIGLMHDAAEAYLGDVIKPLKVILGDNYASLESSFERAIFKKFGLPLEHKAIIKEADEFALEVENECFMQGNPDRFRAFHRDFDLPFHAYRPGWSPQEAEINFRYFASVML